MSNDAKTEAEAFAKLQEAATRAPWRYCEAGAMVFGPTDNEHIADAVIDIRGYGAGLPMDDNGRFVAHARNTALPRLTLEVVAENERLKRFASDLETWAKNMRATRSPDNPIDRGYAFACDYVLGQIQALQEPSR